MADTGIVWDAAPVAHPADGVVWDKPPTAIAHDDITWDAPTGAADFANVDHGDTTTAPPKMTPAQASGEVPLPSNWQGERPATQPPLPNLSSEDIGASDPFSGIATGFGHGLERVAARADRGLLQAGAGVAEVLPNFAKQPVQDTAFGLSDYFGGIEQAIPQDVTTQEKVGSGLGSLAGGFATLGAGEAGAVGQDVLNRGGTLAQAEAATGVTGASIAATLGTAGLGKGIAQRMAMQGAAMGASGEAERRVNNAILPDSMHQDFSVPGFLSTVGTGLAFGTFLHGEAGLGRDTPPSADIGPLPVSPEVRADTIAAHKAAETPPHVAEAAAAGDPIAQGTQAAGDIIAEAKAGAAVTQRVPDLAPPAASVAPEAPAPATTPPVTAEPFSNGTRVLFRGDVDQIKQQLSAAGLPEGMVKLEGGKPVGVYYPSSYADPAAKALGVESPEAAQGPTTWDSMRHGQMITLYRGEGAGNAGESDVGGQWWTTDKAKAEKFGKISEVSLPSEVISQNAARGHNGADEFVFPDKRPNELAKNVPHETLGYAQSIEPIGNGSKVLFRGDVDAMRQRLTDAGIDPGYALVEDGAKVGVYFPKTVAEQVAAVLKAPEPITQAAQEPWQMTRDEYAKQGGEISYSAPTGSGSHRDAVEEAFNRGEKISPEVLRDYPWLAAREAIKPYVENLNNLTDKELKAEAKKTANDLNAWANKTPNFVNGRVNPELGKQAGFEVSEKMHAVDREIEARKTEPIADVPNVQPDVTKGQTPAPNADTSLQAASDTPDAPLNIQYGKRRLPSRLPTTKPEPALDSSEPGLSDQMRTESRTQGEDNADRLGLRQPVADVLKGSGAKVEFLLNEQGLPDGVKTNPLQPGMVRKGLYDRASGRAFVFTEHARTPAEAAFVAAHEVAGHKALQMLAEAHPDVKIGTRTAPEALNDALARADQNPTVKAIADSMGKQRGSKDRPLMVEEAMADLAAATRTGNWGKLEGKHGVMVSAELRAGAKGAVARFVGVAKRIYSAIASKLNGKPTKITDAQVHEYIQSAWENLKGEPAGAKEAAPVRNPEMALASAEKDTNKLAVAETVKAHPLVEKARAFVNDLQMKVTPMATGSHESRAVAKDFANDMRQARWDGVHADKELTKQFSHEQLVNMWQAADRESVAQQQGRANAHDGLASLSTAERAAVEKLQASADQAFTAAKHLGMVEGEGLPSYVPRMVVDMGASGVHAFGRGEAGDSAAVLQNIRTLPMATTKLNEAIAGRMLINAIKDIGDRTGAETVREGSAPSRRPESGIAGVRTTTGNLKQRKYLTTAETEAAANAKQTQGQPEHGWFTIGHPAFKTWRPRFETDPATGKTVIVKDASGNPVFDQVPIYVRDDFKGPLAAVLSKKDGAMYSGLMSLKSKTMGIIMYSPVIHNAVEWGRALPAMPGKVLTFRVYFDGNKAKNDPATMREAIQAGLVPIGGRGSVQDLTSIESGVNLTPGQSWTAKILSAVPGLFDKNAGDAVKRAVDAAGNLWHNTLLWDRVGDLQMGLYTNFRESEMAGGKDRATATKVAARFANQFAGALPAEAMSTGARKTANLMFFSRSFTIGNVGVMKDSLFGLPRDMQAQILRDSGAAMLASANSSVRRKAASAIMLDTAFMYIGNSILQSGIAMLAGNSSLSQEEQDYARRAHDAMQRVKENPATLMHPLDVVNSLTPQGDNEPGKQDRILVGHAPDGTGIYMRNPMGKIGEEFIGWESSPLDKIKSKLSTFAKPAYSTIANDQGYGRKVYDPYDDTPSSVIKNVGRIATLFIGAQVPLQGLGAVKDYYNGVGNPTLEMAQVLGPFGGLTFSKGAPGGEAVGQLYNAKDEQQYRVNEALPDIRKQIQAGDVTGAVTVMTQLGIPIGLQRYYIRTTVNPGSRLSKRALSDFTQYGSPEDRAAMQRFRTQASEEPTTGEPQ